MDETDHAELDERQILGVLRRDVPGLMPVIGVVCNPHVATLLREEMHEARKRWKQPVEILIDPELRCCESEVYYDRPAWAHRCEMQRHSRGHQARMAKWVGASPST
jgi:hypothetical protein